MQDSRVGHFYILNFQLSTKIYLSLSDKCGIDGTVQELLCVNMNCTVIDGVILCKYELHGNRRSYIV